jgi:hypothetical protein
VANGTVAFHFISDAPQALVSWGLWVARSHELSVSFSLVAVLTEAFIITAAFTRDARYRAAAGIGALALLAGFALFQGVIWPTWWLLLLGFLPWERIGTLSDWSGSAAAYTASRAQVVLIVLVIVQQLIVSGAGAEGAPLFSTYDMYSATYASRDAYDRTRPRKYRLVDVTEAERELSCPVGDAFVLEFQKLAAGAAADRRLLIAALRVCSVEVEGRRRLALVGERPRFYWERGELGTEREITIVNASRLAGPDVERRHR